MPPALDKLLANPSALSLLRTIAAAPAPPTAWLNATKCVGCCSPRRNYASESPKEVMWKRRRALLRSRHAAENLSVYGTLRRDHIADARDLAERLQKEQRHKGRDGIYEVWILRTHLSFDLPTDDTPDAEFLWGTFLKDSQVVPDLIQHAADLRKRTGQLYPHLYELCINYWLPNRKHFRKALAYHADMVRELQLESLPLRRLVQSTKWRLTSEMYDVLLEMYKDSSETDLYDEVVPMLKGHTSKALAWHAACILKGDLPSSEVAASPMVQAFLAHNATSSNPEVRLKAAMAASSAQREPEMDQHLLRRLRGRDIAPVRFEDSFCARMFATKALAPDSVIRGLAMVGVNEIGPLAVRAMASSADSIADLAARFEHLRAAGIALQGCVFSLALEKFANEGNTFLVRSILESDQHPEVYDDEKLQQKLLDYYLQSEDWDQAHRTLAILSFFYRDPASHAWNRLLLHRIHLSDHLRIYQTLRDMARHNISVFEPLIKVFREHCLRHRHRSRRPVRRSGDHIKHFDDLRFVARMYMFMLERGIGKVRPRDWREILRRFGMTGRLRELRRLVHWLFCWYAPRGSTPLSMMPRPHFLNRATNKLRLSNPEKTEAWNPLSTLGQTDKNHPLRQLFPDSFQQGLIVWGFRAALLPNASWEQSLFAGPAAKKHFRRRFARKGLMNRLHWDIGLKTLVELRHLCLYVNSATVTKALRMMFIVLFGRGRSKIRANRIMEAVNTTTYPEYVRRVNELWGSPLFVDPRWWGRSRMHQLMWHPRFDRVVHRRAFLRLSDIAVGEEGGVGGGVDREGGVRDSPPDKAEHHDAAAQGDSADGEVLGSGGANAAPPVARVDAVAAPPA